MEQRGVGIGSSLGVALAGALLTAGCALAGPGAPLSAAEAPLGLRDAADLAEARLGVPADLVLAIAWVETRWQGTSAAAEHAAHDEHGHLPHAIGVGGIRPWLEDDLLGLAARALETDEATIDGDPAVGVLATAVVLRELALRRAGEVPTGDVGAWREVVGDYAALRDDDDRARYAGDVLGVLRVGLEAEAEGGEVVLLRSREVSAAAEVGVARAYLSEYEGAHWVQAGDGHWVPGRGGHAITHIIIHTMQGSYSGSIGWFRDPANPYDTSTHYLIRSSDGDITQMVEEADTAHHIGGWNPFTIGIEHEGFIADPGRWYTDAMYRSSARLVAHLCAKYDIPVDREHILGHVEVPGASHTDPGSGWDWNRYMTLVREAGAPPGPRFAASFVGIAEAPTELVSGEEGVVRIDLRNDGSASWSLERTRLGTAAPRDRESPFYADYNWIDATRPTATDAVYASGATGRFSFVIVAPEVTEATDMVETYQLVEEGVEWFGPEVELRVRLRPRDGVGPDPDPPVDGAVTLPRAELDPGVAAPSSVVVPGRGAVSGGCTAAGTRSGASGVALGGLALALVALRGRRRGR